MAKNNITSEIENKIIELKNNKNSINKIIDNIFNEFNLKLSKYSINKIIWNHNTKESTKSETKTESKNEDSKSNISDDEEEDKDEDNKNKKLNNNSLIESLNKSLSSSWEEQQNNNNNNIIIESVNIPKFNNESNNNNNNINNNKDIIHDIIKNTNNINDNDIEILKKKRSTIIIIRQYINSFPNELKNIYINKEQFNKKLFNLNLDQLNLILENFRIELNLQKNNSLFIDTCKNLLVGYEKLMVYSGINLKGISDDLFNDPNFIYDLQILSCEVDIWQYINPKTSCLFKILQSSYLKYEENKIIENLENKINNDDVLNKLKNININK